MTGGLAVSIDIGLHGISPYVDTPFELAYVNHQTGFSAGTTYDQCYTSDVFALAQTSVAILAIGTLMIL
jgi:hypothetical protein